MNFGQVSRAKSAAVIICLVAIAGASVVVRAKFLAGHDQAAGTPALLADVSKALVLPDDEAPIVATVTNLEVLKDQSFFSHAAVGDRVLIYTRSHKAILWRPATKQVVEVATVNLPAATSSSQQL